MSFPSRLFLAGWPHVSAPAVAGIAALLLVAWLVAATLRDHARLSHIPGPRGMGYTNLIMAKHMHGGRMHYKLMDMADKYGASWARPPFRPGTPSSPPPCLPPPWPAVLEMLAGAEERETDANLAAGPIVRTGPNSIVVSDADVLRRMSAVRSEYTRGQYYKAVRINPRVDNIFSMTDDGAHRILKGKMGPGVRCPLPVLSCPSTLACARLAAEQEKTGRC